MEQTNGNAAFAVSRDTTQESDEQRMARLRAKAEVQAATEFDEAAVYATLLAEARAKRLADITKASIDALPTDTQGLPAVYDKVKIYRGTHKNDLSYVPLGLNGLVFKVPRDQEVILPRVVIKSCLEQAVETIMIQTGNGIVLRSAHRFPFNVLGPAAVEEYKAFQQAQREQANRELAQTAM